jgi:2-C-methyl-D-erythritol 4-phosphate cytidylyltransferase
MKKEKTFKRRTEKSQTQNTCKRMLIIYTCEKPQRAEEVSSLVVVLKESQRRRRRRKSRGM